MISTELRLMSLAVAQWQGRANITKTRMELRGMGGPTSNERQGSLN
jgi:hypothetical protein